MNSDWIKRIRKGDILMEGDTPRIVREVNHGKRTNATFVIRRCSWTTRCYTVLTATDLRTRRFYPTGKRVRLDLPMDKEIETAIGNLKIELTCCAVEGIG